MGFALDADARMRLATTASGVTLALAVAREPALLRGGEIAGAFRAVLERLAAELMDPE